MYLTGSFHPSFIQENTGGLLMTLLKEDGGLRPIWRRCFGSLFASLFASLAFLFASLAFLFASLAANATPVWLRPSHLLMITLFKRQVSGMVLPLCQTSLVCFMILLTPQMLLTLKSSD
jgi:hypothetical protein